MSPTAGVTFVAGINNFHALKTCIEIEITIFLWGDHPLEAW
jgi:hypothetical protein